MRRRLALQRGLLCFKLWLLNHVCGTVKLLVHLLRIHLHLGLLLLHFHLLSELRLLVLRVLLLHLLLHLGIDASLTLILLGDHILVKVVNRIGAVRCGLIVLDLDFV